jgi:MarR family transcriptional regulator, transcriptional regulator for hemolysin
LCQHNKSAAGARKDPATLEKIQMPAPTKPNGDLLIVLNDVARHMRTYSDQVARKRGMTRAQWIILSRLERQPNLSQSELSALAEVSPITVARLVDRLEAQGLVERCSDPDDRRIWRLRVTPAAEPVLREIKQFRVQLYRVMTEGVDPAEIDALASGLQRMKENVSRQRRAATAPVELVDA